MGKKRSVGVTILGVIGIVIGLWHSIRVVGIVLLSPKGFFANLSTMSTGLIIAISFIISAVAILQLKHWAPKLFLSTAVVCSLLISYFLAILSLPVTLITLLTYFVIYWLIFSFLPLLLLFIYFTRPKVKEQFK